MKSIENNFNWKNNGRTKVMIGCGTRPEIIRLAAVIKRCREYFDCCVHDRFHESVPGLLLYGRDNPPSGVSGSYSKRSDKFSAV